MVFLCTMAVNLEQLRATRTAVALGIGTLVPTDGSSLDNARRVEVLYLQNMLLPLSQQAHFALLRGHYKLPVSSAITALDSIGSSTRADVDECIDMIVTAHAVTQPDLPPPRRRGVAALGLLRITTDPQLREQAARVLVAQDPAARTIYEAHEEIYSGLEPEHEIAEVQRLLGLAAGTSAPEADKKLAARMKEMNFAPFHLLIWQDRART